MIDIYKNPDVLKVIQDGVENGILTICSRVRSEAVSIAQGFADTGNLMNSIVYRTSIGGNGTIPGVEQPKKCRVMLAVRLNMQYIRNSEQGK